MTDLIEQPNTEAVAEVETTKATEVPTESPDEWDKERAKATILKLREQEKQDKKALKELETLKAEKQKREEAEMTESQRLQKQADELVNQNAKLQADILRRDVVAETGLPVFLSDRLKGTTKEEMLLDAQELLKNLPQAQKNAPKLPPTNPANGELVENEAQKRTRLFGNQTNVFDIKAIQEAGGGVVWHQKP